MAAISRLTPIRLIVAAVLGVALGVGVALQLRAPAPGRPVVLSASPLTAAECVAGQCNAVVATPDELAVVRSTLGTGYSVSGLRISDPRAVLRQISILAADSEHTVTLRGARVAAVPPGWASDRSSNPDPTSPAQLVIVRAALISPSDRSHWVVEVQAASPRGSTQLIAAVRQLANAPQLVS